MQNSEDILKKAENYTNARKWFLGGLALSVLMLCASFVIKNGNYDIIGPIQANDMRFLGWVLYAICLFGIIIIAKRIKSDPVIFGILNDEQAKLNKTRMFMSAYIVLFVATIAAMFLSLFYNIEARFILFALLAIGGTTPPLAYIILNTNFKK